MADVTATLDAVLALVRWQQTRRGYDGDAALISTGLALLSAGENGQFAALERAEAAFNVSWQRIAAEVTQFAVFVVTKAKRDDAARPDQVKLGLRLLRMALTAFAAKREAPESLSVNSCNLLLAALAESLAKTQDRERLHSLQDVKYIFVHLFGLPQEEDGSSDVAPSFQLYRPPTNVFADFMDRALTAAFSEVDALTDAVEGSSDDGMAQDCKKQIKEIVALTDAIMRVYQELQKTQLNKKKVFLAVAKTSLRSIVRFRHGIYRWSANKLVCGASKILRRLDQTIEDALFDAEHIREFDGALVYQRSVWQQEDTDNSNEKGEEDTHHGKKSKKRRHNERGGGKHSALISYQKQLFDELLALLSDNEVSIDVRATGVGAFMNVLMRGFTQRIRAAANAKIVDTKSDPKTSRKRAAVVIAATSTTFSPFKFWAELSAVSFLAFQQQSSKLPEAASSVDAVTVLVELFDSLFKSLCDYDVYRVTEDTEDQEQFNTMEKVLSAFFSSLPSDISRLLNASDAALKKISAMRCSIVSSAVECSPNLVNCCCTAILDVLGAQAYHGQLSSASKTIVDLVQAYDSMRLLDKLLRACFSVSSDVECVQGLYSLLAHPTCEARFRKAFIALPPGQLDVTWQLFVDEISKYSLKDDEEGPMLSIVRLLFQVFMQEIHVTPVNRTKVVGLVTKALDTLVDPVVESIHSNGSERQLSAFEHEVCRVFGELLMFYSAAKVTSATASELIAHFEAVIEKLGGNGDDFVSVIETLLGLPSNKKYRKKDSAKLSNQAPNDLPSLSQNGMRRAGIVKICVHWLRHSSKRSGAPDIKRTEQITQLVIKFVVQTHCWDAIAFYLPDVLEGASPSANEGLLSALVRDYVTDASTSPDVSPVNSAPMRILFDAAFYEIQNARSIAPAALESIVDSFLQAMQSDSDLAATSQLDAFFSLLLRIPTGYLDLPNCGDLLIKILELYRRLIDKPSKVAALSQLSEWLRLFLGPITIAAFPSSKDIPNAFSNCLRFVFQHDNVETMDCRVLAPMLEVAMNRGKDKSAITWLFNTNNAVRSKITRTVTVIQALALVHHGEQSRHTIPEEADFVKNSIALLRTSEVVDTDCLPLLRALIVYQASLKDSNLGKRGHHSIEAHDDEILSSLLASIGPALISSLKDITSNPSPELTSSTWQFFETCCEEYSIVRNSFVADVKGFGLLLAPALSIVANPCFMDQSSAGDSTKPLYSLVHAANKNEFRLLMATLLKEIGAPEANRKLSALVALCDVVSGGKSDRKPSASRRQCLTEFKELLLSVLVVNVGELQQSLSQQKSSVVTEAVIWNLKALMLLFCKPELFTWKAHELAQAFSAFDILYFAASPLASQNKFCFSLHQLDSIWTSSYSLLLRIVRHHFASVVNCIPHLVQASNALLEIVVAVSNMTTTSKLETSPRWPLLVEWTSNLARLFGYMKEHDAQLRKHVVYLIMPFLVAASRGKLPVALQQKLRPGVFALLDMCSLYEKEQLYAALDTSGKSLLKTLDTSYKLTYRYAGKV